jgi:hypothetical protein
MSSDQIAPSVQENNEIIEDVIDSKSEHQQIKSTKYENKFIKKAATVSSQQTLYSVSASNLLLKARKIDPKSLQKFKSIDNILFQSKIEPFIDFSTKTQEPLSLNLKQDSTFESSSFSSKSSSDFDGLKLKDDIEKAKNLDLVEDEAPASYNLSFIFNNLSDTSRILETSINSRYKMSVSKSSISTPSSVSSSNNYSSKVEEHDLIDREFQKLDLKSESLSCSSQKNSSILNVRATTVTATNTMMNNENMVVLNSTLNSEQLNETIDNNNNNNNKKDNNNNNDFEICEEEESLLDSEVYNYKSQCESKNKRKITDHADQQTTETDVSRIKKKIIRFKINYCIA